MLVPTREGSKLLLFGGDCGGSCDVLLFLRGEGGVLGGDS